MSKCAFILYYWSRSYLETQLKTTSTLDSIHHGGYFILEFNYIYSMRHIGKVAKSFIKLYFIAFHDFIPEGHPKYSVLEGRRRNPACVI